jgi:hypothetical protein
MDSPQVMAEQLLGLMRNPDPILALRAYSLAPFELQGYPLVFPWGCGSESASE